MPRNEDIQAFAAQLARRLQMICGEHFSEGMVNRILALVPPQKPKRVLWDEGDVILITYGASFIAPGEMPLKTLNGFLQRHLLHRISCVHVLPFFPSTSDDGFAVSDFMQVETGLGDWNDISAIGENFTLMMDLVINHVSVSHPWFGNFLEDVSPGKDYFIEYDPEATYQQVVRPRNTALFTAFQTRGGQKQVWTTFSADQVDLNFSNPEVLIEMIRVMLLYLQQGARIIRLDAIAFLWKEKNTVCLHLPQTHEVVKLLRDVADFVWPGTLILSETNVPHLENLSYFGKGDEAHMVYQFTLPPLLLHALLTGNAGSLTEWAGRIPNLEPFQTFLNFTASHDGIGVRPLEGILPSGEIDWLAGIVRKSGGLVSEKANPDGTTSPYELNITYFEALKTTRKGTDGLQESRFMCSQLIMLALKGIPAVYIQSLLAAPNDLRGLAETGRARSVNRKQWNVEEVREQLRNDSPGGRIFKEYLRVLSVRRNNPAFHPDSAQQILQAGDAFFALKRGEGNQAVYCISSVIANTASLHPEIVGLPVMTKDILSSDGFTGNPVDFKAYQTRWLIPMMELQP